VIDYLALALTHALIVIALLRILTRDELDREDPLASDPAVNAAAPAARAKQRRARRRRRQGRDEGRDDA